MSDERIRIIVEVSGGVVQTIHSDSDKIDIDILDYDNMRAAEEDLAAREEYEYYLKLEKEVRTLGVKEAS